MTRLTKHRLLLAAVLLAVTCAAAGQTQTPCDASTSMSAAPRSGTDPTIPVQKEVVVVTGMFLPVPLVENNRSVNRIEVTSSNALLFGSVEDYLRLDPTIDLHQRGVGGSQADLSILGSTFQQNLVLLNGLRLNDAQTGHHDMDLPIPYEALSSVELLRGAGSTLYGTDAMAGAVNFVTAQPRATELRLRAGLGSEGFHQEHLFGSLLGERWSETLVANHDFSTGFIGDRDYRNTVASSETRVRTRLGWSDVMLGLSDRPFGALYFYCNAVAGFPCNSWERTKNWFASGSQDLGGQTSVSFGYRRHSDQFLLFRDDIPFHFENNHVDQTWQAALRRHDIFGEHATLSYGADAQGDSIQSSNLGDHARNREAVYTAFEWRSTRKFAFTAAARGDFFSGGENVFTPTVAASYFAGQKFRLRTSASRGFRLPSFTDLYYSDPANQGNPNLKPESAWSWEAGADWNADGRVSASATFFERWDHNGIDYIQIPPSAVFQAMNIDRLHFTGVEGDVKLRVGGSQLVQFSYVFLRGTTDFQLPMGAVSRYAFNYPSHAGIMTWTKTWRSEIAVRTRLGVTQRFQHDTYPVWDLSLARVSGVVRPYLQFANLSNTGYEEVPGVLMPGRSVAGGVELVLWPNIADGIKRHSQ